MSMNNEPKILADILADYRHHILVRACAGSGKTRLLASKYLATLLLKGSPKGIAAITFTEKAAQELKTRIHYFLKRIAASTSEKELENDMDLPWMELTDGISRHTHPAAPAFPKARLWETLKEKSGRLSKALVGSGAPIGTIHAFAMKTLEAYPLEALGGLLTRFDPTGRRLEGMLEDFSAEGLLNASERMSWTSYSQLNKLLAEILELLKRGFPDQASPLRFDASSSHAQTLRTLWPEFMNLASESIHKSREEGYLDYDLLLYWLRRFLFQADETLLAELRARAEYVLLDELQDTDPLQMDILIRLSGLDSPKPPAQGRLFMVGDPFQSIYGFRGACPELIFEKHKESFKEFSLTGNKRSGANILRFVNAAFQGAAERYQPMESAPLSPKKVDQILWHSPPATPDSPEDHRFQEARHAAAAIAELAKKHRWQWRHFALLLRKMTHGWIYLEELRRLGIPAVLSTTDTDILKRSFTVRVLYWLLELIRHPENSNALAFFEHLQSFSPDISRVHKIRESLETFSAGSAVQAVKKEFHLGSLAIEGGVEEIQALSLAENMAWKQKGDMAAFLNFLQAKFESKEDEDTAGEPDVPWEGNCVRIATIHKVKGLQFPCVIMAGLSDWSLKNEGKKILWDPVSGNAAVAFQDAGKDKFLGSDLASFKELKEAVKRGQNAENERLLYVALTRPEEMLVIFEPPAGRSKKSPSLPLLEKAKAGAQPYPCPCCRGENILSLSLLGRGQGEGQKKEIKATHHPNPLPASGAREKTAPALLYASEKSPAENDPGEAKAVPRGKDELYLQSLGRVLHGTLERVPWKTAPLAKDIILALEQSAAAEKSFLGKLPKGLEAEAKKTAVQFLSSPLWRELASKKLLEREFPVAYLKDESLVVGRVDLVYEENSKTLVVADYKTEAASAKAFQAQGNHYLEALNGYAKRKGYARTRFEVISLKNAKRY